VSTTNPRPGSGDRPLVSVVLPTYKRSELLARSIDSVLKQTYSKWELLIVDDNDPGSSYRESTERFMKRYAGEPRIRYLKHDRNRGGSAARNTGIREALGELVAFLDDDDEWHPEKLGLQVQALQEAGPQTALVYTGFTMVVPEKNEVRDLLASHGRHDLPSLLERNTIGTTSTVMARRSALLDVGLFDETLASRQDIDLYVRIARDYRIIAISRPLVTWYRHDGEAIGKNPQASIAAHQLFLAKYREELAAHPAAHRERLFALAQHLLAGGEIDRARERLDAALRIGPPTPALLFYKALATRPGHLCYLGGLRLKALARSLRVGRTRVS